MYHCEIKPSLRSFFICSESVRASSNCSFNSGYFSAIGTKYFTGVNCMVRFDSFKSAPSLFITALFLSQSSESQWLTGLNSIKNTKHNKSNRQSPKQTMIIMTTGFKKEINLRSYSTHQYTLASQGYTVGVPGGLTPVKKQWNK